MQVKDLRALPPTLGVEQAARVLGVSRMTAYRAVKAKQIPTIVVGSRMLVPTPALLKMIGVPVREDWRGPQSRPDQ